MWIDAHPDTDTPETGYDGYHAMAVSHLLGRGDPEIVALLPASVDSDHIALAGLHDWTEDAYEHVADWGLRSFAPDELRESSGTLLEWLRSTGCSRVAIHLDVDVVDSDEVVLGLGTVPRGLTRAQVQRLVADLSAAADVVGLTVAEFIPRSLLAVVEMLEPMPLVTRRVGSVADYRPVVTAGLVAGHFIGLTSAGGRAPGRQRGSSAQQSDRLAERGVSRMRWLPGDPWFRGRGW